MSKIETKDITINKESLTTLVTELRKLQFENSVSELKDISLIRKKKKQIAFIKTKLNETKG